jgi:S-formylglutathione hydrolase FrmB
MKSDFRKMVGALLLLVALLLAAGCAKRENPALPEAPPTGYTWEPTHQYPGLDDSVAIWSETPSRYVDVYTPPGYGDQIVGKRYPVLYLLPGYDGEPSFDFRFGNENYYAVASIAKIADRLIASGEIKPIIIVMPDASIQYGGSFYANSTLAGRWENMMSTELVNYIDQTYRTLVAKESRAIGGHSSGGYGAVRMAMTHPELYNSVSAMDAPLAFKGDCDTCGIRAFFKQYLDESKITTHEEFMGTDTAANTSRQTLEFRLQPAKLLLYSMAATFSPGPKDVTTKFGNLQITLPFDYRGIVSQPIWDKWLQNDLYGWLDDATYVSNLQTFSNKIYFETSDHDVNGFNDQTRLFEQKLTAKGIVYAPARYSGYAGYDARSRSFLYDRMEYILKFHDKLLRDRDGQY